MWPDKMIIEYSEAKTYLVAYRQSLDRESLEQRETVKIVGGMISDLQYSLEWMKKGRRPGNRRGINRMSIYQRTMLSADIEIYANPKPTTSSLTSAQKAKMVDMLLELSERERYCYLLHMGHGESMNNIADELGISKRSVQEYIKRAEVKIRKF